ncbi:MAG: hypothetical protein SF051_08835 [Elusimicrobiota bacterium]|nr:hypothetical protein [Elusimicrobiota bacterium]
MTTVTKPQTLAALTLAAMLAAAGGASAATLTLATGGDVHVPAAFEPFQPAIRSYLQGFSPADYRPYTRWKVVDGVNAPYNAVEFSAAARRSRPLLGAAYERVGTDRAVIAVAAVDGAGVAELARNEALASVSPGSTTFDAIEANDAAGSALVIKTQGLGNGQATVSVAYRDGRLRVTGVSSAGPVGRGRGDVLFCKDSYDFLGCAALGRVDFTSGLSQADLNAQVREFLRLGCESVIDGDAGCAGDAAAVRAALWP